MSRAENIYLCSAHDILRGSLDWLKPSRLPNSWRNIYDDTARFFGMKNICLKRAIDIQIYKNGHPVYCKNLYRLHITDRLKRKIEQMFELYEIK